MLSKEEKSKIAKEKWQKQKKKLEDDPVYYEEWKKKVSNSGKISDKQREARRQNMIKLNKSKKQRERSSENMKNTWKNHPQMNEKSHAWQEDKEKLSKVTKKAVIAMHKAFRENHVFISKNEKALREWLKELGYKLNSGRVLIEDHNRFFDIRIDNFLIEVDGPWHFAEFFDRFKDYNYDPSVDKLKNEFIIENNLILLRVSNWGDKLEDQKNIIEAYLDKYKNNELESGVYYEGVKYENKNS